MAANEEMKKMLATQEAEMKKKVKTSQDSLQEALYRLRNNKDENITVEEVLAVDNAVRKEFGLRPLKSYPVFLDEWSTATKTGTFKKLIGAQVVREKGKLPYVLAEYVECEGYDPATDLSDIEKEVDELVGKLYPTADQVTASQRAAVKASITQRRRVEQAGEVIEQAVEVVEEHIEAQKKKGGRPKKS